MLRANLEKRDGVSPHDVIMSRDEARRRGLTSTVCFPMGNLAPEGSVIKSTAIDPSVVDADGVYRKVGPAKVFTSEPAVIGAIKAGHVKAGDILVLICRGPLGSGMEETYQVTSALKHLAFGKHVAVITDAASAESLRAPASGTCLPEAFAGGPIGKIAEGDLIEIVVDRNTMRGTVNFVGENGRTFSAAEGEKVLAERAPRRTWRPIRRSPMIRGFGRRCRM